MDPPSPQLIRRLSAAGLCRPADLRRCRNRVRRLARDIPAFETVWLDALVQTRRLTAFQAELLGSDDPGRLLVGPFVLVDRAGDDGRFLHYHARRVDSTARHLLSTTRIAPQPPQAAETRLQAFLDRTAALVHQGLALPRGFEHVNGRMWIAAPWTPGSSLQQLLVRRGRFPPACVAGIAAQVCDALTQLEEAGAVHGDLRLRNILLTPSGRCVLVAAGLRSAIFPEQAIESDTPPDDCDGIAPELIGTGQPASAASDVYALGCLLWELLAGRPPHPHGDPLARLAAHQKQRIPDVRDLAPDTPAQLAELIRALTAPHAADRPAGCRSAGAQLLRVRRAPARQLQRLIREPMAALSEERTGAEPRRAAPALAAGLVCIAAGCLLLLNPGARGELLSIARGTKSEVRAAAAPPPAATTETHSIPEHETLKPLPRPDQSGVVRLPGPGTYAASDLAFSGRLVLRGDGPGVPVIDCTAAPLRVSALELVVENVELHAGDTTVGVGETAALLELRVQNVAVRHCRFDARNARPQPAIAWTPLDPQTAGSRAARITDCVFQGGLTAVAVNGPPSAVSFENVLHTGSGALLEVANAPTASRTIDVAVQQTTLRGPAPLVVCRTADGPRMPAALRISLDESVLELSHGALLEFAGAEAPGDWQRLVQITGAGTVIPPGAMLAGVRSAPDRLRPLPTDDLAIDGLMSTAFRFAGPAAGPPADSAIIGYAGYGRTQRPPGIDPALLLAGGSDAYNLTSLSRTEATRASSP